MDNPKVYSLRVHLRENNANVAQILENKTTNKHGNSREQNGLAVKKDNKSKKWLRKLKEKPEEYEKFRKLDTLRCKLYRASLSDEKRGDQNEKARLRMVKYRQRVAERKALGKKTDNQTKPNTRSDAEKREAQRMKWKETKRQQRHKMTAQKRRRINEKRRAQYASKKSASDKDNALKTPSPLRVNSRETSSSAKRVALYRARRVLPHSPGRFANTVKQLICRASPNKSKALKVVGINCTSQEASANEKVTQVVKQLFHENRNYARKPPKLQALSSALSIVKKYRMFSACSRIMNIPRWKLSSKQYLGTRKDAVTTKTVEVVREFLANEAKQIPDRKSVSKKTQEAKSVLDKSMVSLHREFIQSHPGHKIGRAKFCQLRPKSILLARHNKLRQCLCEYCTNINLLLRSINRLATAEGLAEMCVISDVYELSALTMCDRIEVNTELWRASDCIQRNCKDCGVGVLSKRFEQLSSKLGDNVINWLQYENQQTGNGVKKVLKTKYGTCANLISDLSHLAKPITLHLHRARWQNTQFQKLKKDIPQKWVIMVLDFAENYSCTLQDEVQSCHWHHEQATVHPIVTYYNCTNCKNEVVTESLVFISNDKKHDYQAVDHFVRVSNQHLITNRNLGIDYQVQFTDGCAAQYKSKGPFMDISQSFSKFDFHTERAFFGSRHGKGPSDGESAVIKSQARASVVAGTSIITNARELFDFCQLKLTKSTRDDDSECVHFLRTLFWVNSDDIKRGGELEGVKTIKGTREIHSVKSMNKSGTVLTRNLSCFCKSCLANLPCEFSSYVEPWAEATMLKVTSDVENDDRTMIEDVVLPQTSSVSTGSYILAKHGSKQYPVVVVDTPNGYEDPPTTSVYGCYFERCWDSNHLWRLDDKPYLICGEEILKTLSPPNLIMKGARINYEFEL